MEQNDTLKLDLVKALRQSKYKVEITEPNNLELCKKYDGTPFLLIHGDTMKFSVWCGNCIVTVLGHTFTCDFDNGEWSAEQKEVGCWMMRSSLMLWSRPMVSSPESKAILMRKQWCMPGQTIGLMDILGDKIRVIG